MWAVQVQPRMWQRNLINRRKGQEQVTEHLCNKALTGRNASQRALDSPF